MNEATHAVVVRRVIREEQASMRSAHVFALQDLAVAVNLLDVALAMLERAAGDLEVAAHISSAATMAGCNPKAQRKFEILLRECAEKAGAI
jgi:hypothetical protein